MTEVRSLVLSLGTTPVSPKPLEKHKEAERRQALFDNHRTSGCGSAPARSSSPSGVPPRFFPWECLIPRCDAGQASWGRPPSRGGFPAGVRTQFQRCTSHTGHSAGRLMPEPPGSGLQIHPRAPHSPHRPACLPNGVLTGRDDSGVVTEIVTIVNEKMTDAVVLFINSTLKASFCGYPQGSEVGLCHRLLKVPRRARWMRHRKLSPSCLD
jgi:hypothetical protein